MVTISRPGNLRLTPGQLQVQESYEEEHKPQLLDCQCCCYGLATTHERHLSGNGLQRQEARRRSSGNAWGGRTGKKKGSKLEASAFYSCRNMSRRTRKFSSGCGSQWVQSFDVSQNAGTLNMPICGCILMIGMASELAIVDLSCRIVILESSQRKEGMGINILSRRFSSCRESE